MDEAVKWIVDDTISTAQDLCDAINTLQESVMDWLHDLRPWGDMPESPYQDQFRDSMIQDVQGFTSRAIDCLREAVYQLTTAEREVKNIKKY